MMVKAALFGLLAMALAGCDAGQPDISVAVRHHDFGVIKQGEVVSTEMAVLNTGKRQLKIEAVSTSCGCTSARVEPEVITPGQEAKLKIRYDSGVHPDSGPIERHVYIASNDPDEAEVEIIVSANVMANPARPGKAGKRDG